MQSPKKRMDHKAFKPNCIPKIIIADFTTFLSLKLLDQINPKAIPIIIYKTVQTGAKSQLGGLKNGLFTVRNQVFTEDCVAKPDKNPTRTQTEIEIIIFTDLFISQIYLQINKKSIFEEIFTICFQKKILFLIPI